MRRLREWNSEEERIAMESLTKFDDVLKDAIEKEIPNSTDDFWVSGAIDFRSDVPVITDKSNMKKAMKIIADTYQVDPSCVTFKEVETKKIKKRDYDPRDYVSSYYIPRRTVECLIFHVEWKDTKNELLVNYRDYIRASMKRQGIQWESELRESLYNKTRNRTEQFLFDVFVDNKYGTMKWPCISDWEMTKDSIWLAFDYRPDVDQRVAHTTRQSVERRLDNFMENEFTKLYNKELNTKAWYTITPAGVDDDGSGVVIYMYDINSFNSKRKD